MRIVGFNLAEIWIEGDIERERRVDDGFSIETSAGRVLGVEGGEAGGGVVEKMGRGEGAIGSKADVATGGDIFKAGEGAELQAEAIDFLRDEGPEGRLVVFGDEAAEAEAPGLELFGAEPQALEGEREGGDEALRGDAAFGIPECIEAEIVALAFVFRSVGLDAERVDEEFVGVLAIVIGVEEDADDVVAEDVFAFGEAGADAAGGRLADEDDVEIVLVIADPGAGLAADGGAVVGLALAEIVNAEHVGAGGTVDELFEERLARDFGDADLFDVRGRVLRGEGEREQEERQGSTDLHVEDCTRAGAFWLLSESG